jgi:hypothetical protein
MKRRICPSERVAFEIPPKLVSEAKFFRSFLKLLAGVFSTGSLDVILPFVLGSPSKPLLWNISTKWIEIVHVKNHATKVNLTAKLKCKIPKYFHSKP